MADPANREEYAAKAMANHTISGFGVETSQSMPCPGCAEAGWMNYRIIDAKEAMGHDTKCDHCGRSFKVVYDESTPSTLLFEFVQTGGPDLPDWFTPKMRRVN